MASPREVVVTGLGLASPLGLSREAFWQSLIECRTGIFPLTRFNREPFPVRMGGQVRDFDAKLYVTPRKSLKVMSREIQLGFTAAQLALEDAGLAHARSTRIVSASCLVPTSCIPTGTKSIPPSSTVWWTESSTSAVGEKPGCGKYSPFGC